MGKVGQGSIDITDDLTWAMPAAFCVTKREKVQHPTHVFWRRKHKTYSMDTFSVQSVDMM